MQVHTLVGRANVADVGICNHMRLVVVARVRGYVPRKEVRGQALLGLEGLIHHGPGLHRNSAIYRNISTDLPAGMAINTDNVCNSVMLQGGKLLQYIC